MADLQSMEKELADLQVARRFPISLYWVIGLLAHDEGEPDDAWCATRWAEDGGTVTRTCSCWAIWAAASPCS